jgi:TatD DNase family protein
MLVDSHCHLDRLDLKPYEGDLSLALKAAHDRGIDRILCVGIDLNNAQAVIDIAQQHEGIYASVGIHPSDIPEQGADCDALRPLALVDKVIAIGETGLDYYYTEEFKAQQQRSFASHLELAAELNKPVIVHTRNAREDTVAIIREAASESAGGVLHCFTESWEMARQALDLGYYISFSGIITFKNAAELREVVKKVPLDRILVETDSPYLAPMPYRGKKNEPQYVLEVAQCMAELKGVTFEEIAEITSTNFDNLFLNKGKS